jgi:O-antigen/teichoic acid export membrane protein
VPAYLSLTDFGFASVAANTMTMDVARDRRDEALATFQSAWMLTIMMAGIMLILVASACFFPIRELLKLSVMSEPEIKTIFILLSIQVLVGLQSNVNQAGFRCDGNYAFGMLCINMVRLAEAILVSLAVAFKFQPVAVAIVILGTRSAGMIINRINLLQKSSWLTFGFRCATRRRIRELFLPAIGYMAFPLGDAFSLQGITLAIGMFIGPIAVVTFSTLRTLTRLAIQAIRIVMYSMAPEISASYGLGDWVQTRKLHHLSCQLCLWMSMIASAVLFFSGDWVLRVWTHNRVPMDHVTYWILLAVVVANSTWHGSSALLLASNRHTKAAAIYIMVTAASLGLAMILMKMFRLPGAAAALLLIDIIYGSYVIGVALKMLDEPIREWLVAMMHPPKIVRAGMTSHVG